MRGGAAACALPLSAAQFAAAYLHEPGPVGGAEEAFGDDYLFEEEEFSDAGPPLQSSRTTSLLRCCALWQAEHPLWARRAGGACQRAARVKRH